MKNQAPSIRFCAWAILLVALGLTFTHATSAYAQVSAVATEAAKKAEAAAEQADTKADTTDPAATVGSPRAMLLSFLDATARDDIDYARANISLPEQGITSNEAVRKQIMQAIRRLLDWMDWTPELTTKLAPGNGFKGEKWQVFPFSSDDAPKLTAQSDLLNGILNDSYVLVIERNDNGTYQFAASSLQSTEIDALSTAIRKIRRETGDKSYDSLAEWVRVYAPPSLLDKFFFLETWQWIGLGVVIFIGFVLDLFVRIVLGLFLRRISRRMKVQLEDQVIRQSVRGFGLLAAAITWLLLLAVLGLPLEAFQVLQPIARFMFVGAITWCLWRIVDLAGDFFTSRARKSDTKLDDVLVPMLRKTAKVLVIVFALVNLAPLLGLDLGPLLAAVGIGTLGLSFAFKNTLENFFGSVTVILDRPFQVGDWVVCKDIEGTVEAVGMRSTRIRTFYNSLVTMPNSALITNEVDNYGLRKYRRWSTKVGVTYDTPPERIDAYCEAIREVIRQHPYTRKDYYQIWLNSFGDSALEIMVYLFWEAPDWQTELRERHRFMLDIIAIADEMGVEFAFPTQTLYMKKEETGTEKADEVPTEPEAGQAARRDARQIVRKIAENADWKREQPPKYRFTTAEETARIDAIDDHKRAAKLEQRLDQKERSNLPSESGDDPDKPDFTEQRDAGGG
ncbi:MAG: mechanosensitive ion channel [Phycisphaerales bacterium]|nr:mechanosensitive ion channel [Phycisphaerales bacterium]